MTNDICWPNAHRRREKITVYYFSILGVCRAKMGTIPAKPDDMASTSGVYATVDCNRIIKRPAVICLKQLRNRG